MNANCLDEKGNFKLCPYRVLTEEHKAVCPIANIDEMLGAYGYDTREEAIEAWNRRAYYK